MTTEALPSGENWLLGIFHGFIQAYRYCLMLAKAACGQVVKWLRAAQSTRPADVPTATKYDKNASVSIPVAECHAVEPKSNKNSLLPTPFASRVNVTSHDSSNAKCFLQPTKKPLPPTTAPKSNIATALIVPAKKTTGQFFNTYTHMVAPVTNFFTALLPKKKPKEIIFLDENFDNKTLKLIQCTVEVERILALWQQWERVQSNGWLSEPFKKNQQEEIFSIILYWGLTQKLSAEPANLADFTKKNRFAYFQKILFCHSDTFDRYNGNTYYGPKAEKVKARYNAAFGIINTAINEWNNQEPTTYSDIRKDMAQFYDATRILYYYKTELDKANKELASAEEKAAALMKQSPSNDSLASGYTSAESAVSSNANSPRSDHSDSDSNSARSFSNDSFMTPAAGLAHAQPAMNSSRVKPTTLEANAITLNTDANHARACQ